MLEDTLTVVFCVALSTAIYCFASILGVILNESPDFSQIFFYGKVLAGSSLVVIIFKDILYSEDGCY